MMAASSDSPIEDQRLDDSLEALVKLTSRRTTASVAALASEIVGEIPVYDGTMLASLGRGTAHEHALREEWCSVLERGAGVIVVRGAFADLDMLDAVTAVFNAIIDDEEALTRKDHFAAAGANTRVWNSHEKLAMRAPELFVSYYANRTIALASDAWLGPGYQITAQVNVVRPGGEAQSAHRDYHLGFMEADVAARYPRHVHLMSANLTLQGAVAHSDMPVDSGPTLLLPFSQMWPPGYLASSRDDVRELFADRFVQLPLAKGDALFFNPALLHAAGNNRTSDHHRFANLLQVSSAFGRAMEVVDRGRISRQIYPLLLDEVHGQGSLDPDTLGDVIAATAEGYPFPSNVEIDWDGDGLCPPSQQDVLRDALDKHLPPTEFEALLDAHGARQRSH